MSDDEFRIDDKSIEQAKHLAVELKKLNATINVDLGREIINTFHLNREPSSVFAALTRPFDEVASEISLRDVQTDVSDFGVLTALARSLALKGDKFVLDVGTFTTELRTVGDGTYIVWDPPLVGLVIKFDQNTAGRTVWRLISEDPDQPGTHTFTRAQ